MGRVDIVKAINTVVPKNIEFHLTGRTDNGQIMKHNFTGPNTNLAKRLKDYDRETGSYSEVITPPINKLDRGALEHDVAYHSKDLNDRHRADEKLIKVAEEVLQESNDPIQRRNAKIVQIILKGKLLLGIGLSDIKGGCYECGNYGGQLDINSLVREAQQTANTSAFKGESNLAGVLLPLLIATASVGLPALIKLISKKKK